MSSSSPRWIAAALLLGLARGAFAGTVSPSDFDPSLKARDEAILARVKGRVSSLGENASPQTATFPLSRGTFTAEESWTTDPETGEDVLRGRMSFAPGPAASACSSVRLVQAARVEAKLGQDIDWSNGQENRNLMRTKADDAPGVIPGYFVDHDAAKCKAGAPCSPYFRDSWPNPDESSDGSIAPGADKTASLVDYPFGWTYFERISLESCARCADTGEFLGCVVWGGTWPTMGDRSLRETSASEAPSPTFRDALSRFDAFYPAR